MRFISFTLMALLSTELAISCPDLSGTYLCRENSYRKNTLYTFSQLLEQGIWKFRMIAQPLGEPVASDLSFIADGVKRDIVDQASGLKLTALGSCMNSTLAVDGEATLGNTKIHFSENLSLDPQGNLSNISLDIEGKTVQEICERR